MHSINYNEIQTRLFGKKWATKETATSHSAMQPSLKAITDTSRRYNLKKQ